MNSLEQQIDSIVRQVLARLAQEPSRSAQSNVKPETTTTTNQIMSFKVIGIKELESLGPIASRIVIKRGTVVTPAAKEWLKDKQIELSWATSVTSNGTTTAPSIKNPNAVKQIVIGQTVKVFNTTGIRQQLQQRGFATEQLASTGLNSLINEMSEQIVKSGAVGVLLTDQTWNATVQANRNTGVNAVHCKDRIDAANAIKQLKINLLIVNPTGLSSHAILNMIHEITT